MDISAKKQPKFLDVDGFFLPRFFSRKAFLSSLRYKPRTSDVFVVTYPKCGTTLTQMIVRLIQHKGEPFHDEYDLFVSSPFLEMSGADAVDLMAKPAAFKMHLPFYMIPYSPAAKYIFIARNPKDACVSLYHQYCSVPAFDFVDGEFDVFFEYFINGKTVFGDYFDTHLSWYYRRSDPNVHFLTFEDLKKNPRNGILSIAGFLCKDYYDQFVKDNSLLEKVVQRSSFSYVKERYPHYGDMYECFHAAMKQGRPLPSGYKQLVENVEKSGVRHRKGRIAPFFRKGEIGDWKCLFSNDQLHRLEERAAQKTKGTDFMKLWAE